MAKYPSAVACRKQKQRIRYAQGKASSPSKKLAAKARTVAAVVIHQAVPLAGPAARPKQGSAKWIWLPHPCGTRMTSLFRPSRAPQNAKMRPHNRPTAGSTAIQQAVPAKARTRLSAMRYGPMRRRTKARCGVIRPPRQPRRRMPSSAGGKLLSSPIPGFRTLEIEEDTNRSPQAVIRGFLMLFEVEVHSPVRPNPLPPGACNRMFGKICSHAESGQQAHRWTNHFVTFAAPFITDGNEVFLVMPLVQR